MRLTKKPRPTSQEYPLPARSGIRRRLAGLISHRSALVALLIVLGTAGSGTYLLFFSHAQDAWTGQWDNLSGQITAAPAAASWGPGNLQVFVRGSNNAIYQKAWNGSWSNYINLGGQTYFAPAAVSAGPGNMNVFAVGTDYQVDTNAWTPNGWTGWIPLGGRTFQPPRQPGMVEPWTSLCVAPTTRSTKRAGQ